VVVAPEQRPGWALRICRVGGPCGRRSDRPRRCSSFCLPPGARGRDVESCLRPRDKRAAQCQRVVCCASELCEGGFRRWSNAPSLSWYLSNQFNRRSFSCPRSRKSSSVENLCWSIRASDTRLISGHQASTLDVARCLAAATLFFLSTGDSSSSSSSSATPRSSDDQACKSGCGCHCCWEKSPAKMQTRTLPVSLSISTRCESLIQ
jgi:hypothetical protein